MVSLARAWIMQIYFQLATVKKGSSSITEYFQIIKTLNDTLAATGQPLNDFESVSFLLLLPLYVPRLLLLFYLLLLLLTPGTPLIL
jgi:hypothetical protein